MDMKSYSWGGLLGHLYGALHDSVRVLHSTFSNDSYYYLRQLLHGICLRGLPTGTSGTYHYYYNYSEHPAIPPPSPFYLGAGFTSSFNIYDYGDPTATPVSVLLGTGSISFTGAPSLEYQLPADRVLCTTPRPRSRAEQPDQRDRSTSAGRAGARRATTRASMRPASRPGPRIHFTWDGTDYSGVTPNSVVIPDQLAGVTPSPTSGRTVRPRAGSTSAP